MADPNLFEFNSVAQCSGSMTLWCGSGSADPCLPLYILFTYKKSERCHKTVEIKVFLTIFLMMEGSGWGSGSIPLTNESGSGSKRPKNMWIRIRNTEIRKCWIWICAASYEPFLYRKRPPQQNGDRRKRHPTSTREWGHSCLARGYCVS